VRNALDLRLAGARAKAGAERAGEAGKQGHRRVCRAAAEPAGAAE
jgi:hypothetical protein